MRKMNEAVADAALTDLFLAAEEDSNRARTVTISFDDLDRSIAIGSSLFDALSVLRVIRADRNRRHPRDSKWSSSPEWLIRDNQPRSNQQEGHTMFSFDFTAAAHKVALGILIFAANVEKRVQSFEQSNPEVEAGVQFAIKALGLTPEEAATEGFVANGLAIAKELATATAPAVETSPEPAAPASAETPAA